MEVSLFGRFKYTHVNVRDVKRGRGIDVLLKEVAAFGRCPSIDVSLHNNILYIKSDNKGLYMIS